MTKLIAQCSLLVIGLANLWLMWTRGLGGEIRSWWWFLGCCVVSMLLLTARIAIDKQER